MLMRLSNKLSFSLCMSSLLLSRMTATAATAKSKILYIVRHGQALHNPRAEAAKAAGCSMDEFFELMRQDDALDADLTELGRQQARACHEEHFQHSGPSDDHLVDLVVSSTLSRALETAELVYPAAIAASHIPKVSTEHFREVNGRLLNGKRRTKQFLSDRFASWDFDLLSTEDDETWTEEMEAFDNAAERGYQGLAWLLSEREEERVLLVSHGGILRYAMNIHPLIHMQDERSDDKRTKEINSRFDNCEVRKYRLSWKDDDCSADVSGDAERPTSERRSILLTQLDH